MKAYNPTARAILCIGASLCSLVASAAYAQETPDSAPPSESAQAEENPGDIVVTARRREETLISVPIAITAYSGAQLERSGAIDITDLGNTTPNVTLENSRATNSTLSAFIRGIGQQDPVSGFEQGVGIYLDDVYLNRPQAAVLDIYDVERIEVLRGPQGTLYGRNTVGGAVKYVTKRLPAEAALSVKGTYGSYNQLDGIVTGSVPVGDGTLRIGGSAARLTRDGFGRNLTTGLDNYDKDLWAGRLSAEVHATNFFARLSGDYTHDKSDPRNGYRLIPSQFTNTPVLANVYDTQGGLNSPKQDIKAWGVSLFMEATPTSDLTFRSITAYRKDKSFSPIDFDALPTVDVDVPGIYDNKQLSQEVQVLIESGPFHGLIGGYYLDASALTQFDVRIFTTLSGLTAFTSADVHTNTLAGFGDFTYDLTPQFSVSVGGRYTWDERKATILRQNYLGGGSPVFGGAGVAFGAPGTNFRGTRVFEKFTPRASVSFKPTPDHNIYASYSKGFKGGGFDPRGAGVNAPDLNGNGVVEENEVASFLSFAPESVNSYEVGYKGALFDRRFTIAVAGFRADYTNVQIPGSVACTVSGLPSFCGVTSNAGKARFQGLEAEGTARLGGGFVVSGSLGYIDAKFKQYIANITPTGSTTPRPTDVSAFRKVQNTPEWTASATLAYSTSLGRGTIDASTTWSYRSKTYQFEVPNPYIDQPGYSLFDANLTYRAPGGRWSFGIHGKNLLDKHYITSGYTFVVADPVTGAVAKTPTGNTIPALGKEGVLTAFYGNPRQVFGTFTFNF
ncbi:MAG: TonB-dependent receptor [Sphingomonas sp.]|uniref:TonB-dependent receptor n=1 Tax=Sphingomonas sp. TaxID=28214 RepID=UPI00261E7C4F|nr:TonB-dependent receptor [Sphingomonas sp.]MDK2768103.1 TonB-dependent receptor [Sphingomonas sp.]